MAFLKAFLIYLVWPNPGNATYASPRIAAILLLCGLLVLSSLVFPLLRHRGKNPVFKRLSRTWATAAFWFGLVGLILGVSRVEGVGFLAMRLWWVVWGIALAFYLFFQFRLFRLRYYQPLPREHTDDPRERYLPKKKNR